MDWKIFISACLAIIVPVITWALNERSKRNQEIYKRKEERYVILIEKLKGFYSNTKDSSLKNDFLNQLNMCWLYCPDIVIQKAYSFLGMVDKNSDRNYTSEEKDKAVGEFILETRKDLIENKRLRSTNLKPDDFRFLSST